MKNIKTVLLIFSVVLVVVVAAVALRSNGTSGRKGESPKSVSARIRAAEAEKSKRRLRERAAKVSADRVGIQVKRERPTFAIEKKEEDALTKLQRKLLEEIRLALRDDDYKKLMKLVHRMQASNEWPDGIPNSIKLAALEALGWYGSKCLPEIVPFLADANPEIVAEAVSQWEDAIAECDSDREIAEQVKLASRVVMDADSLESILMEVMNMRHSVAVDTLVTVLEEGNEKAYAKVLEQIADFTDDSTITTAEQLDAWLQEHPDDPGDEEMYGGISDDGDDN